MSEIRSEKLSVMLTPSLLARLRAYATRRRWSLSTAAEALIEQEVSKESGEKP